MLTTPQLQALKAAIAADQALAAKPNNPDGNTEIAAAFNTNAAPEYYVWKSSVGIDEIMQNGFDWTRVDNLTVGKARIWEWMTAVGTVKPNQANVRAGVLAVFTTAGDLANRNAVFGHCQRLATRAEKLFASGSGVTSTDQGVGPSTMTFEGNLSYQDIEQARAS